MCAPNYLCRPASVSIDFAGKRVCKTDADNCHCPLRVPLHNSFHSGPHLQADEKRQLRTLPAFQFVPRPADSEKESRCRRLFGQIQAVFYSMALELKKGQNIRKVIPFLLSNGPWQFV